MVTVVFVAGKPPREMNFEINCVGATLVNPA